MITRLRGFVGALCVTQIVQRGWATLIEVSNSAGNESVADDAHQRVSSDSDIFRAPILSRKKASDVDRNRFVRIPIPYETITKSVSIGNGNRHVTQCYGERGYQFILFKYHDVFKRQMFRLLMRSN